MKKRDTEGLRERDWKWIVSILLGIIVFILSYKFWGKSGELTDIISIGSGLVSIALAIVAIIMAVAEGIKSSNKEEKVQIGLDKIITNTEIMQKLINKLEKDIFKTRKQISSFESMFKDRYTKEIQDYNEHANNSNKENNSSSNNEKQLKSNEENDNKDLSNQNDKDLNHLENNEELSKSYPKSSKRIGIVKKGDLFFADLSPVVGIEQGGNRPVVVISNDIANRFSNMITVAPITARIQKSKLPTQVEIPVESSGLEFNSVILTEQTRSIDKQRLQEKVAHLSDDLMAKVDEALLIQFALIDF